MNNNCQKCGNPLQFGTTVCPICGTVVESSVGGASNISSGVVPQTSSVSPTMVSQPVMSMDANAVPLTSPSPVQSVAPVVSMQQPSASIPLVDSSLVSQPSMESVYGTPVNTPVSVTPVVENVSPTLYTEQTVSPVVNPINTVYTPETLTYPSVDAVSSVPVENINTTPVMSTMPVQEPVMQTNFQPVQQPLEVTPEVMAQPVMEPYPAVEPMYTQEVQQPAMYPGIETPQTVMPEVQPVVPLVSQNIEPIVEQPVDLVQPVQQQNVQPIQQVVEQPPVVQPALELNGVVKQEKKKSKFKLNKKVVAVAALVLVGVLGLSTVGKIFSKPAEDLDGGKAVEEPKIATQAVVSNGYKFDMPDGWYVEENGTDVIVTNAAESIYMYFFNMNTTYDSVKNSDAEEFFNNNGVYTAIEVKDITIGTKDAKYVGAIVNQANDKKMPVEYYYIDGGSSLMVGASVIYKTEDAKKNFKSSVTALLETFSYSDDSVKALEKKNEYNSVFNAATRVYSMYGIEVIPME